MNQDHFAFDQLDYLESCSWLGEPKLGAIIRPVYQTEFYDAKGVWPYQSLPDLDFFEKLKDLEQAPLTWSSPLTPGRDLNAKKLEENFKLQLSSLKPVYYHDPEKSPATDRYSKRTRQKLRKAERHGLLRTEALTEEISAKFWEWQSEVNALRAVPFLSAPDANHFQVIEQYAQTLGATCFSVRSKLTNELWALCLLFFDPLTEDWHAHSFLSSAEGRRHYATYLLAHGINAHLGLKHKIYWGGTPSGSQGAGVTTFKQRFVNSETPLFMLAVVLNAKDHEKAIADLGAHRWLPQYRSPALELSPA
jgi:hypothetical protein